MGRDGRFVLKQGTNAYAARLRAASARMGTEGSVPRRAGACRRLAHDLAEQRVGGLASPPVLLQRHVKVFFGSGFAAPFRTIAGVTQLRIRNGSSVPL